MKLFTTLSDTDKERAIHMSEHIVLESLLTEGIQDESENAEEQEKLEEVIKALAHAKTLPTFDEQAEYLFENSATGELILERAYQVASTSFYIEEDESAFSLKEMDDHFDEKESDFTECSPIPATEDEKEFSTLSTNATKKDTKHLN